MDIEKMPMEQLQQTVQTEFQKAIPALSMILEVPSSSRAYDPEFHTNGLIMNTAQQCREWIISQNLQGMKIDLFADEGSPFIIVEVEGTDKDDSTILLYGHMDKQPSCPGWKEGRSDYKPVVSADQLYGRGAADDMYSIFSAVLSVKALQMNGMKHSRVIMLFESDQESGSLHMRPYLEKLKKRVGRVDLVVCLDSICGNYDQLWTTTTARGIISCKLTVKVMKECMHSSQVSGIVPDPFRITRLLLERIENAETGELIEQFQSAMTPEFKKESQEAAMTIEKQQMSSQPFVNKDVQTVTQDPTASYINNTWKAQMIVTGVTGMPNAKEATNMMRAEMTTKLSIRLPPNKRPEDAVKELKKLLTENVPNHASAEISDLYFGEGVEIPKNKQIVEEALNEASMKFYSKERRCIGFGGSLPLIHVLRDMYPKSQYIVTGVLGPNSNSHGPDECLNIPYAEKLTMCLSYVMSKVYGKMKE